MKKLTIHCLCAATCICSFSLYAERISYQVNTVKQIEREDKFVGLNVTVQKMQGETEQLEGNPENKRVVVSSIDGQGGLNLINFQQALNDFGAGGKLMLHCDTDNEYVHGYKCRYDTHVEQEEVQQNQ